MKREGREETRRLISPDKKGGQAEGALLKGNQHLNSSLRAKPKSCLREEKGSPSTGSENK